MFDLGISERKEKNSMNLSLLRDIHLLGMEKYLLIVFTNF
jgi:hypothetical protein